MNVKEALVEAYLRGAAWRPGDEFANLANLDLARVQAMDGSEADAKLLLRSRQMSDANYDTLVRAYHHRNPQFDGLLGPATEELLALERCPIPDFPPPPNASFHYDNPELQAAVESQQRFAEAEYAGGSGSWPRNPGCDPTKPREWHSVRVNVITSGASAHQKATLAECLKMVEACMAEYGHSVRHVLDGDPSQAEHDVRFQSIGGSAIGFAYFPTPGTCNQVVVARLDNGFNPKATVLAELYTHEYCGHSIGLNHTRGGIMNPSIGSPSSPPSWKGDPSEATVRRYFGGVPLPTEQPPTPPTTPTPPTIPLPSGLRLPITITDADGKRYGIHPITEV